MTPPATISASTATATSHQMIELGGRRRGRLGGRIVGELCTFLTFAAAN